MPSPLITGFGNCDFDNKLFGKVLSLSAELLNPTAAPSYFFFSKEPLSIKKADIKSAQPA